MHHSTQVVNNDLFIGENNADATITYYMDENFISIPGNMSVDAARDHILNNIAGDELPSQIFITGDNSFLFGQLSVKKLFSEPDTAIAVSELMGQPFFSVSPEQERHEVANILIRGGFSMVPVVTQGQLVGVLNEKDIARLIKDEDTEDAQRQGASLPLDVPYLATTPWQLWKKRITWLMLLFVAEAYTGTVLKSFQEQLEAAIALAFFIPLLIGTGGNSGTQITSTLVRAMALGEVSLRNLGTVLKKEIPTSFLVATTIGMVAWIRAWFLDVGPQITLVVCLSLAAITVWSAIISSIIPLVLRRFKVDPAVVSAPFIATFIDGTGLIIYFEIAKLVMIELR